MRDVVFACAVAVAAGSSSAQFTVYTDRAAWESAVGGDFFLEDFNSVTTQEIADGSSLNTGLITISRDGSGNMADGGLAISPGTQFGNIDGTNHLDGETGAAPHENVKVSFNGLDVVAFGADFASPFSGDGIALQVGNELFLLDTIPGFDIGFFGVVANSGTFDSVSIVGNPADDTFQELWQADNFSFAVPAPSTAAALGLAGLAGIRRRR